MSVIEKEHTAEDLAHRMQRTRDYAARQDTVKNIASAKLAHLLLEEILASVQPGVRESEVRAAAQECFARHGITRTWHPPHVRFGPHTLLTFMDKARDDLALQEQDIAFVDIGIVLDGIEGDAGKTVAFGPEPMLAALAAASEQVFRAARAFWREHNPSGIELYEHIRGLTTRAGFAFILDPAGHLIGEFPHAGWARGINHFPEAIEAGKWILEIQLRHPTQPYGAFYENLLY